MIDPNELIENNLNKNNIKVNKENKGVEVLKNIVNKKEIKSEPEMFKKEEILNVNKKILEGKIDNDIKNLVKNIIEDKTNINFGSLNKFIDTDKIISFIKDKKIDLFEFIKNIKNINEFYKSLDSENESVKIEKIYSSFEDEFLKNTYNREFDLEEICNMNIADNEYKSKNDYMSFNMKDSEWDFDKLFDIMFGDNYIKAEEITVQKQEDNMFFNFDITKNDNKLLILTRENYFMKYNEKHDIVNFLFFVDKKNKLLYYFDIWDYYVKKETKYYNGMYKNIYFSREKNGYDGNKSSPKKMNWWTKPIDPIFGDDHKKTNLIYIDINYDNKTAELTFINNFNQIFKTDLNFEYLENIDRISIMFYNWYSIEPNIVDQFSIYSIKQDIDIDNDYKDLVEYINSKFGSIYDFTENKKYNKYHSYYEKEVEQKAEEAKLKELNLSFSGSMKNMNNTIQYISTDKYKGK